MRKDFPGFIGYDEENKKNIWENGLITFDANVLLNLYRYSKETQSELLRVIELFADQIWLSHQALLEFHKNRLEVIVEQEKIHVEFKKKLKSIEDELRNNNRPPFLSDDLYIQFESIFDQAKSEISSIIDHKKGMLKCDPIYEKVKSIFNKKYGDPFSSDEYAKILTEGRDRYEKKIPPGFKDAKNKSDDNQFGDLILWIQIIKKAQEYKRPIIFVTDEKKEDWWWKLRDGRMIGPRQELVEEIWKKAEVPFLMYSSDRFLNYASILKKQEITEKTIEELKERAEYEIRRYSHRKKLYLKGKEDDGIEDYFSIESTSGKTLEEILNEIDDLRSKSDKLTGKIRMAEINDDFDMVRALIDVRKKLTDKTDRLLEELSLITKEYNSSNTVEDDDID